MSDGGALFRMLDGTSGEFRVEAVDRGERAGFHFLIYSGPHRDDPYFIAEERLDARVLRVATMKGRGPLVDLAAHALERAAYKALANMVVHRVSEPLQFALFAVDHDDGKGLVVQQAVRELWHGSYEQHAARKEQTRKLLAWAAVAP